MAASKVLDRFTPGRLRVYYGPDSAASFVGEGRRFSWGCNRCLRRGRGGGAGATRSLAGARARAQEHRRSRGHFGMRVVYDGS